MEATATASPAPAPSWLRRSPMMDLDALETQARDTSLPLSTGDAAPKGADSNDEGVDKTATLQNTVAFRTSSSATPMPNSLRSALEALSPSPPVEIPSTEPSSRQQSPMHSSAVFARPGRQPSRLRTPEIQYDDQSLPSTIIRQATLPHGGSPKTGGTPKKFPSPGVDYGTEVPGFNRDLSLVADAIQQACPEAVRKIVRDKWQKCCTGSEYHHAFLMNTMMQHANGAVMRSAVRHFGRSMVREARDEIGSHIRQEDIDAIAPTILEKCSDEFLDKALAQRLKTIGARSLINALARAERLGYESSDQLEDNNEKVVPAPVAQMHSPPTTQSNWPASTQDQRPLVAPAAPYDQAPQTQPARNTLSTTDLRCTLCSREFKLKSAYDYHMQKQLCTKVWSGTIRGRRFTCDECGAWFTTKISQQYHHANAVCGPRDTPTPTLNPSGISTPARGRGAGSVQKSGLPHDPYSHLNSRRKAQVVEELRQIESSHAAQVKEAEKIQDPAQRKIRLDALLDAYHTKQGIIKEKYGYGLPVRRPRVVTEDERSRTGLKHGLTGSPSGMAETPSAKRLKSDHLGEPSSRNPAPQSPISTPLTSHLSVSQMETGLGASTATAATADPTLSALSTRPLSTGNKSSKNSLSSFQRKGYRISSHAGLGPQVRAAPGSPALPPGSASEPLVLSDSSDDDTITDEDIPAVLPFKKVS